MLILARSCWKFPFFDFSVLISPPKFFIASGMASCSQMLLGARGCIVGDLFAIDEMTGFF